MNAKCGHISWTTYEHLKSQVLGWHSLGLANLIGVRQWRADLSAGCPTPFERQVFARASLSRSKSGRRLSVSIAHNCKRKWCEVCMNNLARQWMARAGQEYRQSARTWMVTFTMSPSEHALLDLKASQWVTDIVTFEEARIRAFGGEVRRWFRRLHGDKPRDLASYLAVAELHDSERTSSGMRGRPHFHMLLHEKEVGALIPDTDCEWVPAPEAVVDDPRFPLMRYRVKDDGRARQLWPRGFTKVELCWSEASAVYVCKYLHKNGTGALGRVRASPHYGDLLGSARIAEPMPSPFMAPALATAGVTSPEGLPGRSPGIGLSVPPIKEESGELAAAQWGLPHDEK